MFCICWCFVIFIWFGVFLVWGLWWEERVGVEEIVLSRNYFVFIY